MSHADADKVVSGCSYLGLAHCILYAINPVRPVDFSNIINRRIDLGRAIEGGLGNS